MDGEERARKPHGAFYRELEEILTRCFAPVATKSGPMIALRPGRRQDWVRWCREARNGPSDRHPPPRSE